MVTSKSESIPFLQNLASSDRKVRDESLGKIKFFLGAKSSASLTPLEILKLWQGLYHALWMADRAKYQHALAGDLADLLNAVPRGSQVDWLRGFWATMAREWTNIDHYRLEKFMTLVRKVFAVSLGWMRSDDGQGWDNGRTADVLRVLAEWPFSVEEGWMSEGDELSPKDAVPAGLKLHALDIWVDEAEKVGLTESDNADAIAVLRKLNELVVALEKATTTTAVRIRGKESLADDRLPWNEKGMDGIEGHGDEDDDAASDGSWHGLD